MNIYWIQRCLALLLALLMVGLFVYFILARPNLFNFLPCAFTENLNLGAFSEAFILRFFDAVFIVFLFILGYTFLYRLFAMVLKK